MTYSMSRGMKSRLEKYPISLVPKKEFLTFVMKDSFEKTDNKSIDCFKNRDKK